MLVDADMPQIDIVQIYKLLDVVVHRFSILPPFAFLLKLSFLQKLLDVWFPVPLVLN